MGLQSPRWSEASVEAPEASPLVVAVETPRGSSAEYIENEVTTCGQQQRGWSREDRQTYDRRRSTTTTTQINHVNADSNVSIMNGNVTEATTTAAAVVAHVGAEPLLLGLPLPALARSLARR